MHHGTHVFPVEQRNFGIELQIVYLYKETTIKCITCIKILVSVDDFFKNIDKKLYYDTTH